MNLDNVVYSTRPMNLGEHILCQKAGKGDFESMAAYIVARTNLTPEETLALDDADSLIIIGKVGDAIIQSVILQQIAETLDAS